MRYKSLVSSLADTEYVITNPGSRSSRQIASIVEGRCRLLEEMKSEFPDRYPEYITDLRTRLEL